MKRVYNFSAGPAVLPEEVLREAADEMLDYNGTGMSVTDFKKSVENAAEKLEKIEIKDEETDIVCEKCGRNMVIKYGPHGKFLGCPGFPECHNTKPYLEKIGVACPKCGKDVILKKTKKGRMFYGCEGYPECDFVSWQKPSDKKCPKCGGYMIEKGSKLVCADETCGYVESKNDKEQ